VSVCQQQIPPVKKGSDLSTVVVLSRINMQGNVSLHYWQTCPCEQIPAPSRPLYLGFENDQHKPSQDTGTGQHRGAHTCSSPGVGSASRQPTNLSGWAVSTEVT